MRRSHCALDVAGIEILDVQKGMLRERKSFGNPSACWLAGAALETGT